MKNLLLVLLISLSVFSCGKGKQIADSKTNEVVSSLPSWVLNPEIKDGVAGVGIAAKSKAGLALQRDKAILDAKSNIAGKIYSEISRVTKNALRSASVNGNEEAEDFFSQATKDVIKEMPISGLEQINMYIDAEGTMYLHMALRGKDYSKFLDNAKGYYNNKAKQSKMSRDSIDDTQKAVKTLFDELEKERVSDDKTVDKVVK